MSPRGRPLPALLLAAFVLAACGDSPAEPRVSAAYGYLPLVPGGPAVAYLTVSNAGDDEFVLRSFASPLFGSVELHETALSDGVAGMRRRERLRVPARGKVVLEPGGLHLMLRQPLADIDAGAVCPLTASWSAADGSVAALAFEVVLGSRDLPREAANDGAERL